MPIYQSKETIQNKEINLLIEMDTPEAEDIYRGTRGVTDRVVGELKDIFADGLELSRKCAVKAVDAIDAMAENVRPQEFSIQLAIKLDADLGAVIARTSAGAQLQVTMKWVKKD